MAYNSTEWTTDGLTQAGSSGTTTMGGITLYAYFGIGSSISNNFASGEHVALPFSGYVVSSADADNANLGTGTDPATSVTTADGADTDASIWVPCMWYIPDNISIDSVTSIEGADHGDSGSTRMHLMSYTFTSGSTSCLASGTLVAHSSDQVNAGSEQVYQNTWSLDTSTVSAGRVLICTFESDSINSDYSYNVIIKYHLV